MKSYAYITTVGYNTTISKVAIVTSGLTSGDYLTIGIYNSNNELKAYYQTTSLQSNNYNIFTLLNSPVVNGPISFSSGDVIYVYVYYNNQAHTEPYTYINQPLLSNICWNNQVGIPPPGLNFVMPVTIIPTELVSRVATSTRFAIDFF